MKNTLNLRPATSYEYSRFEGRMNKITIHFPWRYGIFERRFMEDIDRIIDYKLTIDFKYLSNKM
jgi:hypothetical protein